MKWYIGPIEQHMQDIEQLFAKTAGHKHEENYTRWPLFNYTKFARMAWDEQDNLIYYSAGIERPEYDGSIRIMSRHTRDRDYTWGSRREDLIRGMSTLEASTRYALDHGYKDIWVSREENPKLLEYFQKHSFYTWSIHREDIPRGGMQWVLRLE